VWIHCYIIFFGGVGGSFYCSSCSFSIPGKVLKWSHLLHSVISRLVLAFLPWKTEFNFHFFCHCFGEYCLYRAWILCEFQNNGCWLFGCSFKRTMRWCLPRRLWSGWRSQSLSGWRCWTMAFLIFSLYLYFWRGSFPVVDAFPYLFGYISKTLKLSLFPVACRSIQVSGGVISEGFLNEVVSYDTFWVELKFVRWYLNAHTHSRTPIEQKSSTILTRSFV